MNTILNTTQLMSLFPQITIHIDMGRVQRFIEEAEFEHVKEKLSDSLYIDLLAYVASTDKTGFPAEYATLLDGGIFDEKTSCCGDGSIRKRIFKGLYAAIGYYTFSKLIIKNDSNVSRFGYVEKNDEYSTNIEYKIKVHDKRENQRIADIYMADCIAYIESNRDRFVKFSHPQAFKSRNRYIVLN
jgi:hypothetical protein